MVEERTKKTYLVWTSSHRMRPISLTSVSTMLRDLWLEATGQFYAPLLASCVMQSCLGVRGCQQLIVWFYQIFLRLTSTTSLLCSTMMVTGLGEPKVYFRWQIWDFVPTGLTPPPWRLGHRQQQKNLCLFCILGYSKHFIFSWKFSFFWLGLVGIEVYWGPITSWIDEISTPHLCIVCFITFLTIYKG